MASLWLTLQVRHVESSAISTYNDKIMISWSNEVNLLFWEKTKKNLLFWFDVQNLPQVVVFWQRAEPVLHDGVADYVLRGEVKFILG